MATHAHSTRTSLLRPIGNVLSLSGHGSNQQQGPVTRALAAMRAADPDVDWPRVLRRALWDRIERDIALLDALSTDPDLEDGHDAEGNTDDNGIADLEAAAEQGFPGYGGCL